MPTLAIKCMFCDGTFYVAQNVYGVAHSMPPCEAFLQMDALAFLVENRQRIERTKAEPIDEEAPTKPFERC